MGQSRASVEGSASPPTFTARVFTSCHIPHPCRLWNETRYQNHWETGYAIWKQHVNPVTQVG